MRKWNAHRFSNGGFTIIELIISVIIIGILVAIIIPVYVTRADEARLSACQQDLEALQTAQQHAAIDTGYFYRLYVLDDVSGGDGIPSSSLTTDRVDGIRDEGLRTDVANPKLLFIDTKNGTFVPGGVGIFDRMAQNETAFNWNGPYVNVARKSGLKNPVAGQPAGLPLDPWGHPYLFFTKEGLVNDRDGVISTTFVGQDGNSYTTLRFDRPTILSLGPNGVPGNGSGSAEPFFGQGDDLYRQF
ncbi:MAG: prepilin-type N-terminal cleavage/methylation domain-containing protein [Candidatus Sumerlaeaceae bacterium]|jgi:prepilin-type N-terminal cleavage/methylation domain-containing protein